MAIENLSIDAHRELLYNYAYNVLTYRFVLDGAEVTPTSATMALVSPSGTALLAATTATVSGCLVTYTLSTTVTATWTLDENYRADLVVTYASKTYPRQFFFDICRTVLDSLISDDHLPPDLKPAYNETNFSRHIQVSFARMKRDIRRLIRKQYEAGAYGQNELSKVRPALLLGSENFIDAHIAAVSSLVYFENAGDPNDVWWAKHKEMEERYNASLAAALASCEYDFDDDDLIDAGEGATTFGSKFIR